MAGFGDFLKASFLSWIFGGGIVVAIIIYMLFFR